MRQLLAVLALFSAGLGSRPSIAQFSGFGSPGPADSGLGLHDGRGSFYSVTNRPGANNDYFQVTKMTLGGAMLWNLPYNPGVDATASAAAVDAGGSIIVSGTIHGRARRDLLVAKFNAEGGLFWQQALPVGGNPVPTAMATDNDSHIYVAATVSEPTGSHVLVARYGPAGALFWKQIFRAGRTCYARSLVVDANGDAHATVEIRFGDPRYSQAQIRQVVFTVSGAVVPS